jgi:multidrug efflux pump
MRFTDFFIKRPVLAITISLFIFAMGLRSIKSLPVSEYPATVNAVVTVTTPYVGAGASLMAGFITTPIETAVSQASGIDYITSSSTPGLSTVTANLILNYDPFKALSEITSNVSGINYQLPAASQQPEITVSIGEAVSSMYIGFSSDTLSQNRITDYLIRDIQPQIQTINGVQSAAIAGGNNYALRAWLDPIKLAGYGLSAAKVNEALRSNDMLSSLGRTDGQMFIQNLMAKTNLVTVNEFKNLIIKSEDGATIHLSDIARVELGNQTYDSATGLNGHPEVFIAISVTPSADLLKVLDKVKKLMSKIQTELPHGMKGYIGYDKSIYIHAAIKGVIYALAEALLIIAGVIFMFLSSPRTAVIPLITIPLSVIGTFSIMMLFGYSINLLTLLALVLSIGLVVDDTIIVVENIKRYIEKGESVLDASILGARDLARPIIAITIVLIAVFVPIGFMGGLTGALFTQFAFTLAGAITISAVIALTFSPVMCKSLLKEVPNKTQNKSYIERIFIRLEQAYEKKLIRSFNYLSVTVVFSLIILGGNYFLFTTSGSELAPQEDQGIIIIQIQSPPNASLAQTRIYANQAYNIIKKYPELENVFEIEKLNSAMLGMVLKPWGQRTRTTNELQPLIQQELNTIAGAEVAVFQPSSLPGAGGAPIQLALMSTDSYAKLNVVSKEMIEKAKATGMFNYLNGDLRIDKLQTTVLFNREKAAQFGLTMRDLTHYLSSLLSENYVNYFDYSGRSYQVIPQVERSQRLNAEQLLDYYITTATGESIPLSTIASLKKTTVPESLNHFQLHNASIISAVPSPNVSMGKALDTLNHLARDLPQGYSTEYSAESRQFLNEGYSIIITFFISLLIIYLVLAALFESFLDPLIVLISVPMSVCGALIFVNLGVGGLTLNIYSEIGLVTLIGLVSKHGILIVQFANDLQEKGKTKLEAIQMASCIRLRPVLMTTAAMVLGVVPLILASGAAAESRFNIGMVIGTGIFIGTIFTLFIIPGMYVLLSNKREPTS